MKNLLPNLAELHVSLEQAGHNKVASSVKDIITVAEQAQEVNKTTLGPKGRNVSLADDANSLKLKLDQAEQALDQAKRAYMGIASSVNAYDTGQQQAKELLNKWMAAKAAFDNAKEEYAYATNTKPGLYDQLRHDSRKPMQPLMFGAEHGGSLPPQRKEIDVAKKMPPKKVQ